MPGSLKNRGCGYAPGTAWRIRGAASRENWNGVLASLPYNRPDDAMPGTIAGDSRNLGVKIGGGPVRAGRLRQRRRADGLSAASPTPERRVGKRHLRYRD